MSDTESSNGDGLGLFEEPNDYYKPEAQASFSNHTLRSGEDLQLRLVGSNPLWVRNQPLDHTTRDVERY